MTPEIINASCSLSVLGEIKQSVIVPVHSRVNGVGVRRSKGIVGYKIREGKVSLNRLPIP